MDDVNDSDEDNDFEGYSEEGYDDFQMIPFMKKSHSAMLTKVLTACACSFLYHM